MEQPQPRRQRDKINHRYWTRKEQDRFEDSVTQKLEDNRLEIVRLREDVSRLSSRVAYYIGAFSIVVIIIEKLWK